MAGQRTYLVVGAWTLAASVCVGAVAGTVPGSPFVGGVFLGLATTLLERASGPAARLATPLSWGFTATLLGVVLLLPVGVAGYRRIQGEDPVGTVALFVLGAALLPGVPLGVLAAGVAGGAAAVVVSMVGLLVALGRTDDWPAFRARLSGTFAHVSLLWVVVIGIVLGSIVGWGATATVVDSRDVRAPVVNFEANYAETAGGGVVTITHAGGQPAPSDTLTVDGEGFADVDGVDHMQAGPWNGTASGVDGAVIEGDSVTVGVDADCEIRIVYVSPGGGLSRVLGVADCTELRGTAS